MSGPAILPNGPPPYLTCGFPAWENADEFAELWQAYLWSHEPVGPAETGLVEQLVWLDWRRRRLRLGERALHMANLDRATSGDRNDRLTRRALALTDGRRPELSSAGAVRSDDEDDAGSAQSWQEMLEAAETAERLIDAQGQDGYAEAVVGLPEETAEWFLDECESSEKWTADADGLKRFLILEIFPWFRGHLAGAEGGPAVRLQAWGESLDPDRMDKLLALDERLTRQFEKVMGMLIRLQELRKSSPPSK
ncbi:MAG: hypothetical protein AAFS03_12135 [Pseudomonadota bacterium]